MRNALRARRASCVSRLQLEELESRQLLSAAVAGTMLSSLQVNGGSASFSIDNAAANLQTRISVGFERDIDSTQSAPLDHLQLSISIFNLTTQAQVGSLTSTSIGTNYTVTTSSTGSALHLTGGFGVDGSAFGVTFAHASISLDVTWTRTSIDQHVESAGLVVGDGLRELTVSLSDTGAATAAGTFAWTQGSADILGTLPTSPFTTNAKSASLSSSYEQTNDLPDSLSLKPLIQSLSPPDSAPRNSKVSVHSTQAATTGLVINSGSPDSGIRVAQGQDYFDNAQVIPGSGAVAFSSPTGDFGGFCSSGMVVAPDATSADAKGGGTGFLMDSGGNFTLVPFNLDLHWQADPSSAVTTFIRTTTTTPTTVKSDYLQQTDYDALVTGTAFFDMSGNLPTFTANGETSQTRSLTITTPRAINGQVPQLPDATVISKTDWQNVVVKPWQDTLNQADDNGFLQGKGKKKNLLVQLRKALHIYYTYLHHRLGMN